jgi:hypothetical protein
MTPNPTVFAYDFAGVSMRRIRRSPQVPVCPLIRPWVFLVHPVSEKADTQGADNWDPSVVDAINARPMRFNGAPADATQFGAPFPPEQSRSGWGRRA